jgi:hypothetical protein
MSSRMSSRSLRGNADEKSPKQNGWAAHAKSCAVKTNHIVHILATLAVLGLPFAVAKFVMATKSSLDVIEGAHPQLDTDEVDNNLAKISKTSTALAGCVGLVVATNIVSRVLANK